MSRYHRSSRGPTVIGSLLAITAIATMSLWLPVWINFWQWVLGVAFALGSLI